MGVQDYQSAYRPGDGKSPATSYPCHVPGCTAAEISAFCHAFRASHAEDCDPVPELLAMLRRNHPLVAGYMTMADALWKPGPIPVDAYGWGAVVLHGSASPVTSFTFASFDGPRTTLLPSQVVVAGDRARWYCNPIQSLPRE